jgi:DNA-binding CsgD family transcriptional regulator
MPVFDILCLANSNKWRGSCIAGLRLDGGGWIRPVARTSHGELHPVHYHMQGGGCPQIFDRIRVAFIEQVPAAHQPENWLIADQPWQLVSRGLTPETVTFLGSNLIDQPALLGDFSHKTPFDRLEKEPAMSSLCLIRPTKLSCIIQPTSYNAHQPRARFQVGGRWYLLPVTDPTWVMASRDLTPGEYPVTACGTPADVDVLLTVSLGDPFEDGYCYKLIAGVLPLECEAAGIPPALPKPPEALDIPNALMDADEAAWFLELLAAGIDPHTGKRLGGDSLLSTPDTVRALRAGVISLRGGPPRQHLRDRMAQAGKAWHTAEEDTLTREFESGANMAEIASAHGRTPGAIRSRLIRMGKIED